MTRTFIPAYPITKARATLTDSQWPFPLLLCQQQQYQRQYITGAEIETTPSFTTPPHSTYRHAHSGSSATRVPSVSPSEDHHHRPSFTALLYQSSRAISRRGLTVPDLALGAVRRIERVRRAAPRTVPVAALAVALRVGPDEPRRAGRVPRAGRRGPAPRVADRGRGEAAARARQAVEQGDGEGWVVGAKQKKSYFGSFQVCIRNSWRWW